MNLSRLFSNKSKSFFIVLGSALAGAVGVLDYLTGGFSLSIFYLIPICLITWFTGIQTGVLISVACALIYFFDLYTDVALPEHQFIIYWNSLVILGFFLIVAYSLHKLKSALEREKIYARTDYLTGAVNSRFFLEQLDSEIIRSRRYDRQITIAYIDLDDFKNVNDSLGHSCGDRLLCRVAKVIRENLRRTDVLARLGGDEFAILLPETSSEQAKVLIDRLQENLTDVMAANRWPVTFSIGVASFTEVPSSTDEMLKIADSVMYSAKNGGKNGVRFAVIDAESASP